MSVNYARLGSDNGLLPERRPAIIWTNADLLLVGYLWTYFYETRIKTHKFS